MLPPCGNLYLIHIYIESWLKIYGNYFQYEKKMEPEGQPEGRHRGTRRHLAAAPLATPRAHLVALAIASRRPFAYKFPSDLKTEEDRTLFPEKTPSAAAITDKFRGSNCSCTDTLPGRGLTPGAISIDSTPTP